jgi:DNA-binding Xre family transcriptional regulator
MRLRLPELLEERGLTAYQLVKASDGRISMSTAYRIARMGGRLQSFDAELLEALCDALGVEPGELFERDAASRRKHGGR